MTIEARRFAHVNLVRSDVALRALLGWRRCRVMMLCVLVRLVPLATNRGVPSRPDAAVAAPADGDAVIWNRRCSNVFAGRKMCAKTTIRASPTGFASSASGGPGRAVFILHAQLRRGDTTTGRGIIAFLTEVLSLLRARWKLRTLRADSGFFDGAFFSFLEAWELPYVIVARLTSSLERRLAGLSGWRELDGTYAVAEFSARLMRWD